MSEDKPNKHELVRQRERTLELAHYLRDKLARLDKSLDALPKKYQTAAYSLEDIKFDLTQLAQAVTKLGQDHDNYLSAIEDQREDLHGCLSSLVSAVADVRIKGLIADAGYKQVRYNLDEAYYTARDEAAEIDLALDKEKLADFKESPLYHALAQGKPTRKK